MTTRLRTRIRRRRLLGQPVQPARLGLDHGWSWFMPSFLGLGRPWLLVDRQLVGDGPTLGLEPFGSRDPHRPLPACRYGLDVWDPRHITLVDHGRPVAYTALTDPLPPAWLTTWHRRGEMIIAVGDTWPVQLSLAALWDCHIGTATHTAQPVGIAA